MINKRNFLKIALVSFYSIFLQIPSDFQLNFSKKRKKKFKKNLSKVWLLDINDY